MRAASHAALRICARRETYLRSLALLGLLLRTALLACSLQSTPATSGESIGTDRLLF